MIKTWKERWETLGLHKDDAMQAEINELRSALAERDAALADAMADAKRYQWIMQHKKGFDVCVWATDDEGFQSYYAVNQVQLDAAMESDRD